MRSGDLYLAESRRHVSFWHLVYEEPRWNQERGRAYAQLALPSGLSLFLPPIAPSLLAAPITLRSSGYRGGWVSTKIRKKSMPRRQEARVS